VLLDEPKGWRQWQEMALRERDPQKLASIIDQMNRLLDRHEKDGRNWECRRTYVAEQHSPARCANLAIEA
jgi:hypothetical protein